MVVLCGSGLGNDGKIGLGFRVIIRADGTLAAHLIALQTLCQKLNELADS